MLQFVMLPKQKFPHTPSTKDPVCVTSFKTQKVKGKIISEKKQEDPERCCQQQVMLQSTDIPQKTFYLMISANVVPQLQQTVSDHHSTSRFALSKMLALTLGKHEQRISQLVVERTHY